MNLEVIKTACKRFLMDEEGATAVEYALMAALIAAVLVTVVTGVGLGAKGSFSTVCQAIGGTGC